MCQFRCFLRYVHFFLASSITQLFSLPFKAAFEAAEAGKHADLAPKPVAQFYLADAEDVAMAKEEFNKVFMDVKEGKVRRGNSFDRLYSD